MARDLVKIPADGIVRLVRQVENPGNPEKPKCQTLAQALVPELEKIATDFADGEVNFPRKLSLQKAACIRKTIRAIKASKESPKLIRIK